MERIIKKNGVYQNVELLWKEYFRDPSMWYHRNAKNIPRSSNFRNKIADESLTTYGFYNPSWVQEEVRRRKDLPSKHQEFVDYHGKDSNDEEYNLIVLLKACAKRKDLSQGSRLHVDILDRGLLEKNPYLGSTLISMYGKSGNLEKAVEVFDKLPVQDIVTWNALIAAYSHQGKVHEALNYFEQMQSEGLCPNAVTFTCILKVYGNIQDINKGRKIHDKVASWGLLDKDVVLGTALVDMYVKCGELSKAEEVLRELPIRNVVSWSVLITGYAQMEKGHNALECFVRMESEGLSPDAIILTSVLNACGSVIAIEKGKQIHIEILSNCLLENDIILGNALVDMYAKCGMLQSARKVVKELPLRDAVTWSALIAGYAEHGECHEALNCLEFMQSEGLSPDVVTYVSILKACGNTRAIGEGVLLHEEIKSTGFLEKHILLGNAVVDMYAKCGMLARAREVFEEICDRDGVTWNAIMSGYVQHGQYFEALDCFERMQLEGLSLDAVTFISSLKACANTGSIDKGRIIHEKIVSRCLLEKEIRLGKALVDMYAKCGRFSKAQKVIEELPLHDVVLWNSIITGYGQYGRCEEAFNCFEQMQSEGISVDLLTYLCILKACVSANNLEKGKQIHRHIVNRGFLEKDAVLGNALVDLYAKCGVLEIAQEVLEELPVRDTVTWNTLITGYTTHGQVNEVFNCFEYMQSEGISPDTITFVCILKACSCTGEIVKGKQIHQDVLCRGFLEKDIRVGNALLDMYSKCSRPEKALEVLEELPIRDVVSWNTMIGNYVQRGRYDEPIVCLELMQSEGIAPDVVTYICILRVCRDTKNIDKGKQIHETVTSGMLDKDIMLATTLVDMYTNCGSLQKAQKVLEDCPVKDLVAWNTLIAGYAEHGHLYGILNCFDSMKVEGIFADRVTFSSILKACGNVGAIEKGREIHREVVNRGLLGKDIVLGNAVVDMYAKCGIMTKAQNVLQELPVRDVVSWSSLISGYAQQRQGHEALNSLVLMQSEGLSPNEVTFLSVLSACNHSGLSNEAEIMFWNMMNRYDILPNLEHLVSLVITFGYAGDFDRATSVIRVMPDSSHCLVIWIALLSACRKWGNVKLGRLAFDRVLQLDISCATVF